MEVHQAVKLREAIRDWSVIREFAVSRKQQAQRVLEKEENPNALFRAQGRVLECNFLEGLEKFTDDLLTKAASEK